MKALFIHQNFPGQYLNLARFLHARGEEVAGLGETKNIQKRGSIAGITTVGYPTPKGAGKETHHYLRDAEAAVRRGQAAARALLAMRKKGMVPDVICVHPGWGEGIFIKSVYPDVPLVMFCEFYFGAGRADVGFDPEFPVGIDQRFSIRVRNASQDFSLPQADALVCPSHWQAAGYPRCFRRDMHILHEGVNTVFMTPASGDSLTLERLSEPGHSRIIAAGGEAAVSPAGHGNSVITLTGKDTIVSFVSRNLEPYRGFHVFMRSLPELQRRHPEAHILIVGGNSVSYSAALSEGRSYKRLYLDEVRDGLDLSRIHFLGQISYRALRTVFRITSAHVYLTYPFVLSWSLLEAMACESLVVASDTEPVREAVEHGRNGLLVDFFDREALVSAVSAVLEDPEKYAPLRRAARQSVLAGYELNPCLERQGAFLKNIAERGVQ